MDTLLYSTVVQLYHHRHSRSLPHGRDGVSLHDWGGPWATPIEQIMDKKLTPNTCTGLINIIIINQLMLFFITI